MEKLLVYVMGMVCSGKSFFLETAKERVGNVGLVEVGKEFRKRYPLDHFKGQASPEHTRQEALEIYHTQAEQALQVFDTVLVDGQPRSPDQVSAVLNSFVAIPKLFVVLDAPYELRVERINQRDRNDQERDLSTRRLSTDYRMMYDTLKALMLWNEQLSGYPIYGHVPVQFVNQLDPMSIEHILVKIIHREGVCRIHPARRHHFPVAPPNF